MPHKKRRYTSGDAGKAVNIQFAKTFRLEPFVGQPGHTFPAPLKVLRRGGGGSGSWPVVPAASELNGDLRVSAGRFLLSVFAPSLPLLTIKFRPLVRIYADAAGVRIIQAPESSPGRLPAPVSRQPQSPLNRDPGGPVPPQSTFSRPGKILSVTAGEGPLPIENLAYCSKKSGAEIWGIGGGV